MNTGKVNPDYDHLMSRLYVVAVHVRSSGQTVKGKPIGTEEEAQSHMPGNTFLSQLVLFAIWHIHVK